MILLHSLAITYLASELSFFFYYHIYIKPRANSFLPLAPYHDYGQDRVKCVRRIIMRILQLCQYTKRPFVETCEALLCGFINGDGLSPVNWDDVVVSENDDKSSSLQSSSVPKERQYLTRLRLDDVKQEFFPWAFFGRQSIDDMEPWERKKLDDIFEMLRKDFNLDLLPGRNEGFKAKCLNFNKVNTLHRPLIIYCLFYFWKKVGNLILHCFGFQHHRTNCGLGYWHRAAANHNIGSPPLLPLLFFHGISPTGLLLCLPMLLFSLCRDGRETLLFENPAITHTIGFNDSASEDNIMMGVKEAMDMHFNDDGDDKRKVILAGHSMGSAALTYLLRVMPERISQLLLLDPVSILISDPDVISNFLYDRDIWKNVTRFFIAVVASMEVFTNWYLRRIFTFHNCDFWLDDIPDHVRALVCLSGKDEILNADRIRNYVLMHNEKQLSLSSKKGGNKKNLVELIFWKELGHGELLMKVDCWEKIRKFMVLDQEPTDTTEWNMKKKKNGVSSPKKKKHHHFCKTISNVSL